MSFAIFHSAMRRRALRAAAGMALAACGTGLQAEAGYPTRTIRVVVGFAPGGNTDVVARLLARKLSEALGQPVIVENKAGAGGNLAGEAVARAAPDGYTLLAGNVTTQVLNLGLYGKQRFDAGKDFVPVGLASRANVVLGVSPAVPADNLAAFIQLLKAQPGVFNYASPSNGGVGHLAALLFNKATGVEAQHVPYQGGAAALADLVQGRVAYLFDGVALLGAQAAAGKVRLLAVSGSRRDPQIPAVPTFAELGFPSLSLYTWNAWFAPAGTPRPIVLRLNAAINKAMQDPELQASLLRTGNEAADNMTPEQLLRFLDDERRRWLPVMRASGVMPQ